MTSSEFDILNKSLNTLANEVRAALAIQAQQGERITRTEARADSRDGTCAQRGKWINSIDKDVKKHDQQITTMSVRVAIIAGVCSAVLALIGQKVLAAVVG